MIDEINVFIIRTIEKLSIYITIALLYVTKNLKLHFMPYLIAIAIVIVAGIGFTLFQSEDSTVTPPVTDTEITRDVNNQEAITSTTSTPEPVTENNTPTPATEPAPATTNTAAKPTTPTQPAPAKPVETPAVAYDYKNGTYSSKITYNVPDHKTYTMDVSLTIENDKVTSSNIVYSSNANGDGNTKKFNNAYSSQVIGKDIDSINLSRVGGASLTTNAFNNAVSAVKANAKS